MHFLSLIAASTLLSQLAVVGAASSSSCTGPTANTLNGTYYGYHNSFYNEDFFLGMPYAQPPVNNLRYEPPQALNSSWAGAKNATQYGYECVGYGLDTESQGNYVSEDCLTLNVIRPSGYDGTPLPVGVWIHGGGYVEGGGADHRYNLSFIVQNSAEAGIPIIGVSINYRLAGWGFLFSKELQDAGAGNLGLRDQRMALHWVQENIASFGGDPTKVTIWGESAGAGSVGAQLVAYGGRDDKLFRGAIAESGAPILFGRDMTLNYSQTVYDNVTRATNCSAASDTLQCLREVPFEALNSVLNSSVVASGSTFPVIDGDFLQESPTLQLKAGTFVKVPFLIGANHDEGTAFGPRGINTTTEVAEYLVAEYLQAGDNSSVNILLALYPDIPEIGIPGTFQGRPGADLGLMYKRTSAIAGDYSMHASRRATNQAWAAQNVTSYSYLFNVLVNGMPNTVGATHFQEVAFMLDNTNGLGYPQNGLPNPFGGEPQTYTELARLMTRMWAGFISGGDPNLSGVPAPTWPAYTLDNPQTFIFNANVTNLSYVEPDIYRAEGIQWMIDNMYTVFGR